MKKVGLIGIGGFGKSHVGVIMNLVKNGILKCTAFAETNVHLTRDSYERLTAIGARHYNDYRDMLENHSDIDFITIATPIPLHKSMSIYALNKGFNVLLEKPPAVVIQDLDAIIKAKEQSGKLCGVNFQNTSGKAFRLLIDNIRSQVLGEIKSVTGVGMWKRTQSYYQRTSWAGKLKVNQQYVLDGTITNPLAHLLNNCLIAAGYGDSEKASPEWVQGELYKGHDIEGEDTSCLRIGTKNGVEVRFYATLCNATQDTPFMIVEGSKGRAFWDYNNFLKITYSDGHEQQWAFESEKSMENMYINMIEVIEDPKKEMYSPVEKCRSFVLASNGAFESSGATYKIPDEFIEIGEEDGTITTYIKGIEDIFKSAYTSGKMFSEISVKWAVKTHPFSMKGYKEFNMFL